jgi:hypothetical protein
MIFAKKFQPIRKHNWSSSHFEFPIERKVTNNVDDHQININLFGEKNIRNREKKGDIS